MGGGTMCGYHTICTLLACSLVSVSFRETDTREIIFLLSQSVQTGSFPGTVCVYVTLLVPLCLLIIAIIQTSADYTLQDW